MSIGMKKILIVDDEEQMRNLLSKKLTERVFIVETAATGMHALTKVNASKTPFDLVICDLKMPQMDGVKFFHQLKKISPKSKFLLMTGSADVRRITQGLKIGINQILIKPFSHSDFIDKVDSLVGDVDLNQE